MPVRRNLHIYRTGVSNPSLPRLRLYSAVLLVSMMLGNFLLAAPPGHASSPAIVPASHHTTDADILAAYEAYERRDLKALDQIRARVSKSAEAHILAPYVRYWALSARLLQRDIKPAELGNEVSALLTEHSDAAFADTLRRDWLRALGEADAATAFASAFSTYTGDDAEVSCQHWRFRLAAGDREALSEAKTMWKAARAVPEVCYQVFAHVAAARMLTPDEAWARVRTLFDNNQGNDARRSATLFADLPPSFDRDALAINRDPVKFLTREKVRSTSQASVETFLFAITKLARNNVTRAAEWLAQPGNALPADARAHAWAQVGLYGAMQHDPEALSWFARAGDHALSDAQAAWKVRAALRAHDWTAVHSAISSMSATEQLEPAWRYWRARADLERGQTERAKPIREALARENHFYGILSAEELGMLPSPQWPGFRPTSTEIDAMRERPGIRRALALYRLELRPDALREWALATRNLSDQELLAAAEVARAANAPDRAIQAADRTLTIHDFSQRFPTPHRTELGAQVKTQRLDEAWVYGLIRQESRFQPGVRSSAGAAGLMQLMPATARWTAKQIGMKNFAPHTVTEVPVNLQLGSYYLRHVLDQLGHPVLATAAYNAGPNRAKRWQAERALEGAIYAETIPFNETRDYVKKVMANAWFYQHQFGMPKPSLKAMMGTIAARGTNASNAASASAVEKEAGGTDMPHVRQPTSVAVAQP